MTTSSLSERLDTTRFHIVDSHCHLGYYAPFDIQGDCAHDLIRQMDETGVDKIALSPLAGLDVDAHRGNDDTARFVAQYPDRVLGMAVINPNREQDILPELARCMDTLRLTMIKLHPDFSGCPMSRTCYDRIYGFAQERSLAILNHDWQSPQRMEHLARRYPRARFIQAHSAGNWDGHRDDDYFRVARDYPNAFVDICASPVYYDALEKLIPLAGEDSIVYGSDMPFLALGFALGKVMMADLPDRVKRKILGENFLRAIG